MFGVFFYFLVVFFPLLLLAKNFNLRFLNTKKLYIYNYNDHLDKWKQSESFFEICERSSVRLSYADSNKNGAIEASTEIIEETGVTRLADFKKI